MTEVAAHPPVDADARRITEDAAPAVLAWYDRHRRDLPWRSKAGTMSDPYRVWLSEIMLQQTTVAAVKPYYAAFLQAWPTVGALAAAPLEDILKAWAGLGYYSRARNLHACARTVVDRFGGRFPGDEPGLRGLPGIGRYTAAAIAAIAFDRRAVVVDGNVERVMARLFAVETPLPQAKPALHAAMDRVTPPTRVGDFAQAVMDLGATICTPRSPACSLCPLMPVCRARRDGSQTTLPRKVAKKAVPHRTGAVLVVRRTDGAMLVRQRPPEGLFGGMTEFPTTAWVGVEHVGVPGWPNGLDAVAAEARQVGTVLHGLTHFSLELQVYLADGPAVRLTGDAFRWVPEASLDGEAFPTLMRKVLHLVRQTSATTTTLAAAVDTLPFTTGAASSDRHRPARGSDAVSPLRGSRPGRHRRKP